MILRSLVRFICLTTTMLFPYVLVGHAQPSTVSPNLMESSLSKYEARLIDHDLQIALGGGGHGLSADTDKVTNEHLQHILHGVEENKKESFYFFGLLKLYGISLPKDVKVAVQSFRKASELGHAEAATAAGVMYLTGVGVDKDYTMAIISFRRGVGLGDKNALWMLGKTLMEIAGSPDIDQVMKAWKGVGTTSVTTMDHARNLDKEEGNYVGNTAHEEAFRLLKLAAKEDIPQAFHYLGILYEYGLGIPQDFTHARSHYLRAAENRYIESMYHLALMFAFGRGGEIDYRGAIVLLEAAGRADHAPSCYYMGVFKMYGYACEPDYNAAYNWFEKAAALDDYRISAQAATSASHLSALMTEAEEYNSNLIDEMKRLSEYVT